MAHLFAHAFDNIKKILHGAAAQPTSQVLEVSVAGLVHDKPCFPFDLDQRRECARVVSNIHFAVVISAPDLHAEMVEMANFHKRMFLSGEIGWEEYLRRMQNLFPEQWCMMTEDVHLQIIQINEMAATTQPLH